MALYALHLAQGTAILGATIVNHHEILPQCGIIRSPQPQTDKPTVRYVRLRRPMHQWSPLRGQKILIYAKPQRSFHRENGAVHALEVQEQVPRKPRISSARVEHAMHIVWLFLSKWTQNASEKMQPLSSVDGISLAFIFPYLSFLGVDRTTAPIHGWLNCTTPSSNSSSSNGEHRQI